MLLGYWPILKRDCAHSLPDFSGHGKHTWLSNVICTNSTVRLTGSPHMAVGTRENTPVLIDLQPLDIDRFSEFRVVRAPASGQLSWKGENLVTGTQHTWSSTLGARGLRYIPSSASARQDEFAFTVCSPAPQQQNLSENASALPSVCSSTVYTIDVYLEPNFKPVAGRP
jgi:hypothetical protein